MFSKFEEMEIKDRMFFKRYALTFGIDNSKELSKSYSKKYGHV